MIWGNRSEAGVKSAAPVRPSDAASGGAADATEGAVEPISTAAALGFDDLGGSESLFSGCIERTTLAWRVGGLAAGVLPGVDDSDDLRISAARVARSNVSCSSVRRTSANSAKARPC